MRVKDQLEILSRTRGESIDKIDLIQELWSGYGSIFRVHFSGTKYSSVIVKNIVQPVLSNHPRGWDTEISNARKIKSYEVETNWYKNYTDRCGENCRVPRFIDFWQNDGESFILLEDLNPSGFPLRKSHLTLVEIKTCLRWLANFHVSFLNIDPTNLWEIGTYWHLQTRPDEFNKMADSALKQSASMLDAELNNCKFSTLVHGDAKVANFCFGKSPNDIAAVDFQYVGGGCGMKDVAYFLGSCLDEDQLEMLEDELLMNYFAYFKEAIYTIGIGIDFNALEKEWRRLYPIAWADFTRFLLGWMPTHQKLNRYSKEMVRRALNSI
ncbi:MAG: choline kinase [Fluviicola sp.]|nr:MAG: choline kinase [Fluviicola sp.]